MRLKSALTVGLLLCLLLTSCAVSGFNSRLDAIVNPYRFSIFGWEVQALSQEMDEFIFNRNKVEAGEALVVVQYFDIVAQIDSRSQALAAIRSGLMQGDITQYQALISELEKQKNILETKAEQVLERQIKLTLAEAGIYNPWDSWLGLKATVPPVKLSLEEPPQLLVVSSRDKIERLVDITLKSDLSLENTESLEDSVAGLDVSALVVNLGGIATYPSFVNNNYGLRFAIDTAIEEWLHQYLFFRPLGFRYGLDEMGIKQPYEIIIMNETLASMVSQEVGDRLYRRYYTQFYKEPEPQPETPVPQFDFNRAMREIRQKVDVLLAHRQVEQAEAYMEEQRLVLASHGYFIRKLNQAYFAFYGSYADEPGFMNPIGEDLKALRAESASLNAFVNAVSAMTSRDELARQVQTYLPRN